MTRTLALAALLGCVACTPGSFATASGGTNPTPTGSSAPVTIDVDLTLDPAGATSAGQGGGYHPLTTTVAVGTTIRFNNSDGFHHTATSIAGTTFPSAYPFTGAALNSSGDKLSTGFSSGSLDPGASSQPLLADLAGTYIFGCFYHYGTPMRAVIVVQ